MASTGYIIVRAYTSTAQLPLKDVAVVITAEDGTALSMGLTDRSGLIPPLAIPVPDKSESQTPNPDEIPYITVNLRARLDRYEEIEAAGIQIFADTTTSQDLEMIPLSELPNQWDSSVSYSTPPQNL